MVNYPNTPTNEAGIRAKMDAFFTRHPLLSGSKIVVGFSWGPDSTALLTLLIEKFWSGNVVAAHFDHTLRGEESDGDREFCRNFCEARGVAFEVSIGDVAAHAKNRKIGLEEAGRELRYVFFEAVAEKIETSGASAYVATGHTADDQAETVVMRLAKGTKLRGLRGIPERSGRTIRPLLFVRKRDILDFLDASRTHYRLDSSNADTDFDRNRIRTLVMPELEKLNPEVANAIVRFTGYAGELDEFVENEVSKFLGAGESFAAADFTGSTPFFRREILSRLFVWANGTGVGLSEGMVAEMDRFCEGGDGGKSKTFGALELSRAKSRISYRTQ